VVGLELEALAVEPEPMDRERWLKLLGEVDGEELKDPCTGQVIGKRTNEFVVKTDTTSAIIEISVEPGPKAISKAFQALELLGVRPYARAYYPPPGRRWYLKNATPRGHYRLLHWYGYSHWEIATMASSQVWLDVSKEELPRVLDAINKASPWLLKKYSNSPFAGWKEYRVRAWQLFSERSWASAPYPWAPKPFSGWADVLEDLTSGAPQEAEPCLDLSLNAWEELAEAFAKGKVLARRADMGLAYATPQGVLKGMQRWTFRPAIARWRPKPSPRPEALKGALEGNPKPFLDSLEKVMVEVRLLPYLPQERLEEAVEDLLKLARAEPPEVGWAELREAYVRAAMGKRLPEWASWPEGV